MDNPSCRSVLRSVLAPLPLLVSFLLSACFFDQTVDPGPQISCQSNADCPSNFLCKDTLKLCVPIDQLDDDPPGLDGEPTLSPEIGRFSTIFTLSFSVSEELGPDPSVLIGEAAEGGGESFSLVEAATDRAARRYTFVYAATGATPEGSHPIRIELMDSSGNVAADLFGGTLNLDFTPPRVDAIGLTPTIAGAGVPVRLDLSFDEELGADPLVGIVLEQGPNRALRWSGDRTDQTNYVFRYTPSGDEHEGRYLIDIQARDRAGNTMPPRRVLGPFLDFGAPRVEEVGITPTLARPGEVIRVNLWLNETPVTGPDIVGRAGNGGVLSFDRGGSDANLFSFTHPVATGEDGAYALQLQVMQDTAGNTTPSATIGHFTIDGTAPTLVDYWHSASGDALTSSDVLEVRFSSSELLGRAPVVHFGGLPMSAQPGAGDPFIFTLPLNGTGLFGLHYVEVELEDVAGNRSSESRGPIDIDSVPPGLINIFFTPEVAWLGISALMTVTTTEPLAEPPVVTWAGPTLDFQFVAQAGLSYTFALDIDGRVTAGDYVVDSVSLVDSAGNRTDDLAVTEALGHLVTLRVDNLPPVIWGVQTNRDRYSQVPPFDLVRVSLEASESFTQDQATLTVTLSGEPMSCIHGTSASGTYLHTCEHTVDGSEGEGAHLIKIEAWDSAGNTAFDSTSVVFDFNAPLVVPGTISVDLIPGEDSPLRDVSAVAEETAFRLGFAVSEVLQQPPQLTARLGSTSLAFVPVAEAGAYYLLELPGPFAGVDQGAYEVEATLVDAVSNSATHVVLLPEPGLVVDTVAPDAPAASGGLFHYQRSPWGVHDTQGAPRMEIWSEPQVAEDESWLIAYDAEVTPRLELGRWEVNPSNGFDRFELNPVDRVEVFIALADRAGNLSPAARVDEGRWIATMGRKIAGSITDNPHRFETRRLFTPWRQQGPRTSLGRSERSGAGLITVGDGQVTSIGAAGWWSELRAAPVPGQLYDVQAAFDSARGRLVVVGDATADPNEADQTTLEWSGHRWQEIEPSDPEQDGKPTISEDDRLCYDPQRGLTLLVVGADPGELWGYDGESWAALPTPSPLPSRPGAALTFDTSRGRLLLHGGWRTVNASSELWSWDGEDWIRLAASGSAPAVRHHAIVYDLVRDEVVSFGGFAGAPVDYTFTWDAFSHIWTRHDALAIQPSARMHHAMVYDIRRGEVVLFGGETLTGPSDETYFWDGATWRTTLMQDPENDGDPPPTARPRMSYDRTLDRPVLVAGDELWVLESRSWRKVIVRPVDRGDGAPDDALEQMAMAYDSAREEVVLVGGLVDEVDQDQTWLFDGLGWVRPALGVHPTPGRLAAMSFDWDRSRAVLVFDGETWEWDGSAWHDRSSPTMPDIFMGHAMAYDDQNNRVVSFAGASGFSPVTSNTWMFSGGSWDLHIPDPSVIKPRMRSAMAYFPEGPYVFAFGGVGVTIAFGDNLAWNGASWSVLAATDPEGDGGPNKRSGHTLAYNPDRGVVTMMGGGGSGGMWDWNGESWRNLEDDLIDPSGDGAPHDNVSRHGFVYDSARRRLVLFGGDSDGATTGLWEWQDASTERPAHAMRVSLPAAQLPEGTELLELEVSLQVSGQGDEDGVEVDGAELFVWRNERWELVHSERVAPAVLSYSVTGDPAIRELVTGEALYVAVAPVGVNGLGAASLSSDYVELTLRYRLP